ncbi:hypothetical protein ACHWQZ_G011554 [Mnemiopsis leidyi]
MEQYSAEDKADPDPDLTAKNKKPARKIEFKKTRFRFKDIGNNYLEEILKDYRSHLGRAIWSLLFLVMGVVCGYIAYQLLSQYFEYDSYNLEYTTLANSYHLPAITICSLNVLNYTKMIEVGEEENKEIYKEWKAWYSSTGKRDSESDDREENKNDLLDSEEIYTKFAREPSDHRNFTSEAYTSSGLCLEMNDNEELVQKVNGAIGGLALTLDALTEHYLPETAKAGFRLTFRMPNETVLSQEFGILLSPGKEYHINLHTKQVSRLSSPWGNCLDKIDHFENAGLMTMKECNLDQMLWMYPRLRDVGCGCFPWYFYQRYVTDSTDRKYSPDIKWRLVKYWTETLPEEFRLSFNDTCLYDDTGYTLTTGRITATAGVNSALDCEYLCRNNSKCRYFMYSNQTNNIMTAKDCWLHEKQTDIEKAAEDVNLDGIKWGDINCYNMDGCSLSAETSCINKIMNKLMKSEEDESYIPPTCYEPCSYRQYEYQISSSDYPTERYWNSYLKDIMKNSTSKYESYEEAKSNLLKVVIFTDKMMNVDVEQTASYELSSFISEFGGLVDLFVGISFFTCYQIIEWLISKTVDKINSRPRNNDNSNEVHFSNTNL